MQFRHEVPELTFLVIADPAPRYQIADSVLLGCFCWTCWEPLHGTGGAADCIQSAIDCSVHFFTNSLQRVGNILPDLLLQRHQVCCGGHTCLLLRCATAVDAADPESLQPAPLACDGAYQRSTTMSNGTQFCGAPCANANTLAECSSVHDA